MRIKSTLSVFLIALLLTSCKKDKSQPAGEAQYDNSNLGTYSGVLVGSSGHITLELKQTGATAILVFDEVTYNLSSSVAIQPGTKVTGYALQKDAVKVTFDVNADGSVPHVAITIPGHDVSSVIYKVTSSVAVENYTGTVNNTDNGSPQYNNSGILNFAISGNNVTMISKCKNGDCGGETFTKMSGKVTRNNNGFIINFDNCNIAEAICSLTFTKTTAGYTAVVPIGTGIQLKADVKKVN